MLRSNLDKFEQYTEDGARAGLGSRAGGLVLWEGVGPELRGGPQINMLEQVRVRSQGNPLLSRQTEWHTDPTEKIAFLAGGNDVLM